MYWGVSPSTNNTETGKPFKEEIPRKNRYDVLIETRGRTFFAYYASGFQTAPFPPAGNTTTPNEQRTASQRRQKKQGKENFHHG